MKYHKSNYCSCSTPSNEKSKWFIIVLVLILVGALSYPYILKYAMGYKSDKPVMTRHYEVSKKYQPGAE